MLKLLSILEIADLSSTCVVHMEKFTRNSRLTQTNRIFISIQKSVPTSKFQHWAKKTFFVEKNV